MFGFKIIVSGERACFTRPEMKVERESYDVPTPSALEGMLKSIYWKPAIRYVIDKIIVYNPIRFANIKRNEVGEKISLNKVKSSIEKSSDVSMVIDASKRDQRATMFLTNVKYGIEFHFEMTGIQSDETDDTEEKHYNIIKRRLEKGQCFRTPCLGCCEFPVREIHTVDQFDFSEIDEEIRNSENVDLGFMLYGLEFSDHGKPLNNDWKNPIFSDLASAVYYHPHMIGGVIDVNKYWEEKNVN